MGGSPREEYGGTSGAEASRQETASEETGGAGRASRVENVKEL